MLIFQMYLAKIPTYRVNSLSLNTFQSRGRDKIFKIRPYFILLTATTVLNTYKRVIDTVDRSVKTQGESRLLASRFAGQKKFCSPRDGAYVSPRLVSVIRRLVVNTGGGYCEGYCGGYCGDYHGEYCVGVVCTVIRTYCIFYFLGNVT